MNYEQPKTMRPPNAVSTLLLRDGTAIAANPDGSFLVPGSHVPLLVSAGWKHETPPAAAAQ